MTREEDRGLVDDYPVVVETGRAERVREALSLPWRGHVYDLSFDIANHSRWPGHGPVVHSVSLTHRQGGDVIGGGERVGMMTDRIDLPLHAGTHVDAPNHFSIDGLLADGRSVLDSELAFARGKGHFLGSDSIDAFVGVGVLIDVTKVKPLDELGPGAEITRADILASMEKQEIEALPRGGAVVFHTGWSRHFRPDRRLYFSGEPGLGLDAVRLLVDSGATIVGADNHAFEAWPTGPVRDGGPYPVHQELLVKNRIPILENLNTYELAGQGVSRFLLVVTPLRVRGASGSPVTPIAIV
jgi:kynurenine formamidase